MRIVRGKDYHKILFLHSKRETTIGSWNVISYNVEVQFLYVFQRKFLMSLLWILNVLIIHIPMYSFLHIMIVNFLNIFQLTGYTFHWIAIRTTWTICKLRANFNTSIIQSVTLSILEPHDLRPTCITFSTICCQCIPHILGAFLASTIGRKCRSWSRS